tara:strand:+ start:1371 stop:1505 length:135 start_codon:yes stop_codon:yes gene_type:complete
MGEEAKNISTRGGKIKFYSRRKREEEREGWERRKEKRIRRRIRI